MQRFLPGLICCLAVVSSSPVFADAEDKVETYTATVEKDGVQHIPILAGSYFFKPNRIVVKKNVPVELSVSLKSGIAPHTIVAQVPDASIAFDEPLSSSAAKIITFTPTAAGEYVFYCKNKLLFLRSHRERGMQGVIEVVE